MVYTISNQWCVPFHENCFALFNLKKKFETLLLFALKFLENEYLLAFFANLQPEKVIVLKQKLQGVYAS